MIGETIASFYRICCFGVFLGLMRLAVPNEFKGISSAVFEIMLLLILTGPIKDSLGKFDLRDFETASCNFDSSFEDLKKAYMKDEIEELIKEKLKSEGIIPGGLGIDINMEEDAIQINGCYIEVYKSQRELFAKNKEKLEKELGFPFYEKGE